MRKFDAKFYSFTDIYTDIGIILEDAKIVTKTLEYDTKVKRLKVSKLIYERNDSIIQKDFCYFRCNIPFISFSIYNIDLNAITNHDSKLTLDQALTSLLFVSIASFVFPLILQAATQNFQTK